MCGCGYICRVCYFPYSYWCSLVSRSPVELAKLSNLSNQTILHYMHTVGIYMQQIQIYNTQSTGLRHIYSVFLFVISFFIVVNFESLFFCFIFLHCFALIISTKNGKWEQIFFLTVFPSFLVKSYYW